MSSFKKNRLNPNITSEGLEIIKKSEDYSLPKSIKGITIPCTQEMSEILEKLFHYFDGDISRRKICSKYLLKSLKEEAIKLNLIKPN